MDDLDRKIINKLQYGFPVCERPYTEVSHELGTTEGELINRLEALLDEGLLSRFGPMYHAENLGGAVSLAALAVPAEDFDKVATVVNSLPEIAHNYERTHTLNMWFVIATETPQQQQQVIEKIEQQTGLKVYNMPKIEEFFVGFYLDL